MSEIKTVKYKIIESTGFSDNEKPAEEALDAIRTYVEIRGGWFYLDGAPHLNLALVTPQMLEEASLITVTNIIQGGVSDNEVREILSTN
jgi:hypothetical protein